MEINRAEATLVRESMILSPVVKQYSEVKFMENYAQRAITRINARNLSELPIERINVYMSGREDPILGTNFYGGYPKEHHMSQFFSSIGGEAPYTIKAIVSQGEKKYSSGEMTIHKSGFLDIDIGETVTVMNFYADRERTTLIAREILAPAGTHPEQGNHPLV